MSLAFVQFWELWNTENVFFCQSQVTFMLISLIVHWKVKCKQGQRWRSLNFEYSGELWRAMPKVLVKWCVVRSKGFSYHQNVKPYQLLTSPDILYAKCVGCRCQKKDAGPTWTTTAASSSLTGWLCRHPLPLPTAHWAGCWFYFILVNMQTRPNHTKIPQEWRLSFIVHQQHTDSPLFFVLSLPFTPHHLPSLQLILD